MQLFPKRKPKNLPVHVRANELEKLKKLPLGTQGSAFVQGKVFQFHDAASFAVTYKEIMIDELYKFHTDSPKPFIIDCGANMGLSVLYFSQLYPQARIMAFEPEGPVYEVLQKNMQQFGTGKEIEVYKKAVWDSATVLQFYTDHGMGGSVENKYRDQVPTEVQTVRLADYLQEPVDFLKIDIEGAEYTVLKDCESLLKNVQHIFVEYHSFVDKEQKLEEILAMLKNSGFRYHLRESSSRPQPFVDSFLICENMDMAINVFGYR